VREGEGPCLVLSGPGSGKTKTLVHRAAYLIEKGVSPSRIILITFTKKAAREMLSRIKVLTGKEGEKVYGGTFHHIGNLYLRRYANEAGLAPRFTILDEEDSKNLLSIILKEKGEKNLPKAPVVQKIISLSINSQKKIEEVVENFFPYLDKDTAENVSGVYELYRKRKEEGNLVDYDDLLLKWKELLLYPGVGEKISSDFLYILVDEYQDTNVLQDEIVEMLGRTNKNILVVGDDAQSIYSFRAADIGNILRFPKKYPDAKIFKLEDNYRSVPEILQMANRLIENNTEKLEKKLRSSLSSGKEPVIRSFSTAYEQARYIADIIERKSELSETAVLFRAHYQSIELEVELVKRNIPYVLRGGPRFFEKFHVKDLLAFLKILSNHRDETSWQRILTRIEGVGEVYAGKIVERIYQCENLESAMSREEEVFSLFAKEDIKKELQGMFTAFRESIGKTAPKAVDNFMNNFYEKYLHYTFEDARERKNDLKRVKELAENYESIEDMLAEFSLSEDYRDEERGSDKVTLSSVHQAKGLEWETVFIISLKDGYFPHGKALEEGLVEEERRLFYVAITRCKRELFLTYPVYDFKEKESLLPSRFLREIKDEDYLVEELPEDDVEEEGWEYF